MRKKPLLVEEINPSEKTFDQEQTEDIYESAPRKTVFKTKKSKCIVCRKLCSYKCPKCSKNYCSIEHFRSHNLFCSEQFFEKQVKETLKGLKVTDKKEKSKVVEMMNNFRTEIDDDYMAGEITAQRLEELLKQIQSGKEPQLSKIQKQAFQQYLDDLNIQTQVQSNRKDFRQQKEDEKLQLDKAYWEDEEGLSLYLQENIEIQDYAESENPQLIAQRSLYKKQLDQFLTLHPYTQSIIKPVINLHLIQIIFEYLLLYRVFDGQLEQFRKIFITSYTSKENQALLKTEEVQIKDFINQIYIQLLRNEIDEGAKAIIKLWMEEYWEILINDLRKIFRNTFLVIETLLRIMELANSRNKKYQQVLGSGGELEQNLSKQEKKQMKMQTKIVKKCEYLLYFVKYKYNEEHCLPHLSSLNEEMRKKSQTKNQSKLLLTKTSTST